MYAVIRTGGKQYRVTPEDVIVIEKITGDEGSIVEFAEVLMVGGDGSPQVGAPTVSGASVAGQVVTQGRGDKILVFKKKRRKNYRRKAGHRQELTTVRITEILTGGKKPSKAKAAAKPDAKKVEAKPAAKPAAKKAEAKPAAKAAAKPKAAAKKPAAEKPAAKAKKDS
jgi:large subunit ribosomal protein L21